jgi:putative flippase GtrA
VFKKITSLLVFLFILHFTKAQYIPISESAEVSIITIGPGEQLYDKFGHSAFRVKDVATGFDIVYNYGTYDFSTPNFYTKFARGKLLYQLSERNFYPFLESYKSQNRWVKEQILNLSYSEKESLFNYLQNNAKPENASYKYDFFFDNCATKIRDVLVEVLGSKINYTDSFIEEPYTFRQLIQKNVKANSWGSLGMDVAIGSVTDRKANAWQHQFLPNYVFEAAAVATIKKNNSTIPLVKKTKVLFENTDSSTSKNFFTSPFFVFSILGLLILFFTYKDYKNNKRSRFLDSLLFFSTGLVGVILAILWFGTDHTATANNYNLLWAFPFTILFFIPIGKKAPKKWISRYLIFLLLLMSLLFIHWLTGVQEFAVGFLPLFIALIIRYIYVTLYIKKQ